MVSLYVEKERLQRPKLIHDPGIVLISRHVRPVWISRVTDDEGYESFTVGVAEHVTFPLDRQEVEMMVTLLHKTLE